MPPLLSKEKMDAMDSGDESDHDPISMEMLETFVTKFSLTRALIEEKPIIKYAILLSKDNQNKKER